MFDVNKIKREIDFWDIYFAIIDLYDNLNFYVVIVYAVYSETDMFPVIVLSNVVDVLWDMPGYSSQQ